MSYGPLVNFSCPFWLIVLLHYIGHAKRKRVLRLMRTAHPLSDHGIHCPLTEILDTVECISGGQMPE